MLCPYGHEVGGPPADLEDCLKEAHMRVCRCCDHLVLWVVCTDKKTRDAVQPTVDWWKEHGAF